MPDKQNENKFMAMLERRGIVRKAGLEEESPDEGSDNAKTRSEADLRSILGATTEETPKITPAARQPIPGLSTPVMPGERSQQLEREQPKLHTERSEPEQAKPPAERTQPVSTVEYFSREKSKPAAPEPVQIAPPEPEPWDTEPLEPDSWDTEPLEPEPPEPVPVKFEPVAPEPVIPKPAQTVSLEPKPVEYKPIDPKPMEPRPVEAKPMEPLKPVSFFSSIEPIDPFKEDTPAAPRPVPSAGPAAPVFYERPPEPVPVAPVAPAAPVENYTERYLDIDELYDALSLRSKKTDTIYLIEEYLQTLPDSLPDQSRREIVSKLVAASGFDYDLLMGDGVLRVKMLKEYAERFAKHTDDYVSTRNSELAELEQQAVRIRKLIEARRELHKKQFFALEAEAQRLKEILTFISG